MSQRCWIASVRWPSRRPDGCVICARCRPFAGGDQGTPAGASNIAIMKTSAATASATNSSACRSFMSPAGDPGWCRRRHGAAWIAVGESSGDDCSVAGEHADPRRQRRLCTAERLFGISTLRDRHTQIDGAGGQVQVRSAKAGKPWRVTSRIGA